MDYITHSVRYVRVTKKKGIFIKIIKFLFLFGKFVFIIKNGDNAVYGVFSAVYRLARSLGSEPRPWADCEDCPVQIAMPAQAQRRW